MKIAQSFMNNFSNVSFSPFAKVAGREDVKNGLNIANRDTLVLSKQGKEQSFLQSLMKQKVSLTKQRESFLTQAREKGLSSEAISEKLKEFEEQLKSVDEQLIKLMSQKAEEEKEKQNQNLNSSKPMTEEELENSRMGDLISITNGISNVKTTYSIKKKIDAEARTLKSEIELDKSRGASEDFLSYKKDMVSKMEERSAEILSRISKDLENTEKRIDKKYENVVITKDEPEETESASNETEE